MAAQAGEAKDFGRDALARKGRIAVQQQRQNLGALLERNDIAFPDLGQLVLLGARLAHDDRVDDFEMRGLAVSDRCTLLPSNSRSDEAPR